MSTELAAHGAARFHENRPTDLREPPPWHRLAYIGRALPAAIAQLVPDLNVQSQDSVLDYGCADIPYRRLFPDSVDYVAADLPGNSLASVEILPDGRLPVADGTFDAVLSTQVLEHVADPEVYLSECFRVLRPDGRILLSTHGIMVYHPDPVDHWRWTCEGLRKIASDAGFEVLRFDGIMGLAATGLQLFQDGFIFALPRRLQPAAAFVMQKLVALADRFQTRESRRLNSLVFAVIARKP